MFSDYDPCILSTVFVAHKKKNQGGDVKKEWEGIGYIVNDYVLDRLSKVTLMN